MGRTETMVARSQFQLSLQVLSKLDQCNCSDEEICWGIDIGYNYYKEICASLIDWELIEQANKAYVLTDRGKNILSYYMDLETQSQVVNRKTYQY